MNNAAIIYEGPSVIDGKPIVAIATYSGRNRKTGAMVQTYILRADLNPLDASKTGEDASICGRQLGRPDGAGLFGPGSGGERGGYALGYLCLCRG